MGVREEWVVRVKVRGVDGENSGEGSGWMVRVVEWGGGW